MALPGDETKRRPKARPLPVDDEYGVKEDDTHVVSRPAAPVRRPAVPPRPSILERSEAESEKEVERRHPEPTRLPFLIGVFNFPWYLRTMAAWGMIAMGLAATLLGVVVCIYFADMGFPVIAVRCFGVPVLLIATLTLSYASACCLMVVETTAEGYDEVIDWPSGFWRDWFFTMMAVLVLLAFAAAIGGVIGKVLGIGVWLSAAVSAYVLSPVFILSTLEAGSPTAVVSWPVVRSFWTVWWGWLLFYVETGVLIAIWAVPTVAFFQPHPWVTSVFSGPLLGAVMFIYARLIGRLAWCLGEYGDRESDD
ncbi:MAG TPA: hypothetical protein VMY37_30505 [Thermoguttaceae bacterium]|nr:hypothetical protein [Thermoguttaceae bacterium]